MTNVLAPQRTVSYVNPAKVKKAKKEDKQDPAKPKHSTFDILKDKAKEKAAEKMTSMATPGGEKAAQSTSKMIPRIPRNAIVGVTQVG